jgi:hypothetical protein
MTTDPRKIPGTMAGPGGPHDRSGVILDARNAVLLQTCDVSTVDPESARGQAAIAMVLGGRINQTKDRASVLFIFGTDGAAAILTELLALLGRSTGVDPAELLADITDRMDKLRDEGNLGPAPESEGFAR